MNTSRTITQKQQAEAADFRHLPFYSALKGYDESQWLCFGTLTHKHPTSAETQLKRFEKLMHRLGSLNGSFGKRLHWVVRVEGGADHTSLERRVMQSGAGLDDGQQHTHLHFLVGRHKVADGDKHTMTAEEAGAFLEKEWLHGRAEVVPYVQGKDGLGYVLKCPGGPTSAAWQDRCELSDALLVFLKKSPAIERDPFAVEILGTLRARGARAWFGDEVPHWKNKP